MLRAALGQTEKKAHGCLYSCENTKSGGCAVTSGTDLGTGIGTSIWRGAWLWKLEYWVNKRNGGENQQTSGRWLWKVQEQEVNCNSLDAQDSYWKRFRSNRTNNEAAVQEGVSGSLPGSYYY